jgi:hypothetical protein
MKPIVTFCWTSLLLIEWIRRRAESVILENSRTYYIDRYKFGEIMVFKYLRYKPCYAQIQSSLDSLPILL